MMRSLYSGVSGLKVHQTKMDVIGNNISNVNTVGFKSSGVTFSDVFYQTTQSATGPNANTGAAGQNAMQVGLGSTLGSITASITETGGSQRTDNPFDVMITGDSFFVVNSGGTNYFTKSGAFRIDAAGTLCTTSGATVMGWQVDPTNPDVIVADTVKKLNVMSPENMYSEPEATTAAYISGNIDQNDSQINGTGRPVQIEFYDNMGNAYTAKLSIKKAVDPGTDTLTEYAVGVTDILGPDGKSIFATKEKNASGVEEYVKTDIDTFTFGGVTYTAVVDETDGVSVAPATGSTDPLLVFNAGSGKFESVGAALATYPNGVDLTITSPALNFKTVNIDFSTTTQFSTSGQSSLTPTKGDLNGIGAGKKVGNMTGVSIDTAGKIYGKYDNGDSVLLGQIAVASFANPSGLEAVGGNMFAETQNSGEFDGIGKDPTQGGGSLTTGVLEMSNVDLSSEFTEMITTQRGFQANSRIITTSDSMLEELINLKR